MSKQIFFSCFKMLGYTKWILKWAKNAIKVDFFMVVGGWLATHHASLLLSIKGPTLEW